MQASRSPVSTSCAASQLVGQDPRQQPRARHDDQAQLLKEREGVQLEPVLHEAGGGVGDEVGPTHVRLRRVVESFG